MDQALQVLSKLQQNDGGFYTWTPGNPYSNSESCAQVVVALTALGLDPHRLPLHPERPQCAGRPVQLCGRGQRLRHLTSGERNGMATEQGYYALTAYFRLKDGKTSLYDMSDVTIQRGTRRIRRNLRTLQSPPIPRNPRIRRRLQTRRSYGPEEAQQFRKETQ